MTDAELEDRLKRLTGIERKALVLLLAHLGEFEERRLYADRGHPSLFAYCLRVLGYSEQAAYKRIQAARAARDHPEILRSLADGEVTLTAVVILAPHLRRNNAAELLALARGRRTREIEAFAAGLAPRPDCADMLRSLPAPRESPTPAPAGFLAGTEASSAPTRVRGAGDHSSATDGAQSSTAEDAPASMGREPGRAGGVPEVRRRNLGVFEAIEPLSAGRHLFRFTGSSELRVKYESVRDLLSSARSGKSMEGVIEAGIDALLDRLDPRRRLARRRRRAARRAAGRDASRRTMRRIPSSLRDEVWVRDGGRCTFKARDGARCPATSRLEIDHVRPYALGGTSDDPANLRLLCRTHNQLLARRVFGEAAGPRARYENYPQG